MPTKRKPESARFRGPAKYAEYLVARVLVSMLQRLPIRIAYRLGRGVGWLAWKTLKRRRATVRKNLEVVNAWMGARSAEHRTGSGEHRTSNKKNLQVSRRRSPSYGGQAGLSLQPSRPSPFDDLDQQVKEVLQRSGANLFSGFTFNRMSPEQAGQHVQIEGIEHLKRALAKGKGAILLLAHMGPWEALNQLPGLAQKHGIHAGFGAMYRPFNNVYLDRWFRSQREARSTQLFSRLDGLHKPVDFLRGGGILGILADQKMGQGVRVPYFGVPAMTNPVPGLFQRRSHAPVLTLSFETIETATWQLKIEPVSWPQEIAPKDRETPALVCNQALEQAVSRSPLDTFWLHNRF